MRRTECAMGMVSTIMTEIEYTPELRRLYMRWCRMTNVRLNPSPRSLSNLNSPHCFERPMINPENQTVFEPSDVRRR